MHLQGYFVDAMIAGELCRFFPEGNYFLFPLPIEHLTVLRRPAVSHPVGHGVGVTAAGATGETHDHTYPETLGQQHGAPECLGIAFRNLRIGGHWIPVTA